MWLLRHVKDFTRKINLNSFGRWANHLLYLKNCKIQEWIWGFSSNFCSSITLFIAITFSVYENFVNHESSFLNQNNFSNFKNLSNSDIRIESFAAKSSSYANWHKVSKQSQVPQIVTAFLVWRKCDNLETLQYLIIIPGHFKKIE